MTPDMTICVTGASGALGRALLSQLCAINRYRIRTLVRAKVSFPMPVHPNVIETQGDLLRADTLDDFLVPGATVVNLAYLQGDSSEQNVRAIDNLAAACATKKISRFIHCSTAVVCGRAGDSVIDENTPCNPANPYEATKLAVEKHLLEIYSPFFEITVLRPTAVFGPGCKNLVKLADDLTRGRQAVNYLKSCLFNQRRMNLVCLDNVIAAVLFFIESDSTVDREIFIISDDEDPGNNYRDIEKLLLSRFQLPDYLLPRLPLPGGVLRRLLALKRRSNTDPMRIYSCQKIKQFGFTKPILLDEGLSRFAVWYHNRRLNKPEKN